MVARRVVCRKHAAAAPQAPLIDIYGPAPISLICSASQHSGAACFMRAIWSRAISPALDARLRELGVSQ
jgi:hypothetical protein